MKLSRLIAYRESLDDLPFAESMGSLEHDVSVCVDTLNQSPVQLKGQLDIMCQVQESLSRDMENFRGSLDVIKKVLDEEINDRSKDYFSASYNAYESIKSEPVAMLMHRELRRDEQGEKILRHRVKLNSNWKYPGMLIRTQKEDFFNDMVDSDPLYLLDTSYDLLEPCLSAVSANYRSRLRTGMIDEGHERLLCNVPHNEIGFAFVWNFFNYRPMEVLRRYFMEIYDVLRPGGVCIFTYNNCSRSMPVILCEHAFASFTPAWAIKSLLNSIGYEIIDQYDGNYHLNFLEIRKPGDLRSLRGGQTLATITAKPFTRARMQELKDAAASFSIELVPGEIDYFALEAQVNHAIEEQKKQESMEIEKQRLEQELKAARNEQDLNELMVDIETQLAQSRELRKQAKENEKQQQERAFKEQMLELIDQRRRNQKIIENKAINLNIPNRDSMSVEELEKAVQQAEHMQELNHLRKEAVRLKLDRTDVIMRKYTLKELKRAIKKWRAENERPPT